MQYYLFCKIKIETNLSLGLVFSWSTFRQFSSAALLTVFGILRMKVTSPFAGIGRMEQQWGWVDTFLNRTVNKLRASLQAPADGVNTGGDIFQAKYLWMNEDSLPRKQDTFHPSPCGLFFLRSCKRYCGYRGYTAIYWDLPRKNRPCSLHLLLYQKVACVEFGLRQKNHFFIFLFSWIGINIFLWMPRPLIFPNLPDRMIS